jgi:membrane-associated protease RseP (regulator of RpoE activity)
MEASKQREALTDRMADVPDYQSQQPDVTVAELAVGQAPASEIVQAELAEPPQLSRRRRRVVLPLVLFLLTCASTFFAGVTGWMPMDHLANGASNALVSLAAETGPDPYFMLPLRRVILEHWQQGLLYMACVLAILLTHEMGHFLMTLLYRVRASLPIFLPLPISPIGTMGAVIAMDGSRADRKQIFDIGLAGPLAGLVVAIPIVWIGASQLDLSTKPEGYQFGLPLAVRLLMDHLHPAGYQPNKGVAVNQLNPYFMAGWVGLLVTGLNMMPVSQLDGGHVLYALFGRGAHWLARLFMLLVFGYMAVTFYLYHSFPTWLLMAMLVLFIGTDHPPTRDDSVRLGWFRVVLGVASLLIPVLCFAPNPIR